MTGFYDAGAVQQVAINLFYGWGYNFYREENQLRADDQLIRRKAGELLGQAHDALCKAESEYRRVNLPPPSRAHPFPDAGAVTSAQTLERLAHDISALKARINAMPVPEGDRMTQRYRQEGETLKSLIASDEQLAGQSELLRQALDGRDGQGVLDNLPLLHEGVAAISATLQARAAILNGTLP